MKKQLIENRGHREKVFLVIVKDHSDRNDWAAEDLTQEMQELVLTSGGEVVDHVSLKLHKPTASTYIGSGQVEEIANLAQMHNVDTVIFNRDLKGSQQRNLEEIINKKTIDRTQLILDIFAKHARSNEGKMQVELAQLEYLLPRLVGKGIELSRLGGGIGTLGPGETKLEVDRRRIAEKITSLKRELKKIEASRVLTRKKRQEKGVPTISLVGYTNAGKSTLLNTLTDAQQTTHDGLFTTLDSLSRQLVLPNHQKVILSDTVGFMHELPHHLIESFKATLEVVHEADLLLHVIDISHENYQRMYESVVDVLKGIGIKDKPVIHVLNKIDKISDPDMPQQIRSHFEDAVCVSAKAAQNIDALYRLIEEKLSGTYVEIQTKIPIGRMDLVNLAHEEGEVYSIKYYNDHIDLRVRVPAALAGKFTNH